VVVVAVLDLRQMWWWWRLRRISDGVVVLDVCLLYGVQQVLDYDVL
jgi:hypothetical protein